MTRTTRPTAPTVPALAALALAFAAALPGTAMAAEDAPRAQAIANFFEADANGDGRLTAGEFRTLVDLNAEWGIGRAALVRRYDRYAMVFGKLDIDGDGLVTVEEIAEMRARFRR